MARPRIVIVGAGFGGLAAAKALGRAAADVVLIDQANHHLFQPLLYQVATAALAETEIATASRALLRRQQNTTVIMARATGIDLAARHVTLADTEPVAFDYLVLATGAAYSFFGHDDWAPRTCVLKSLDDATAIRSRLLGALEWAESRTDPDEVRRLTTIAIVGGGPTGVELAGSVAELTRMTLARDFRRINPAMARIVLFESGPRLLAAFPERLSRYAERALQSLGVEVHTGAEVTQIDADGLLAGGQHVAAANVLWAAGVAARPAAAWLGVAPDRHGALPVGPDCSVPGLDGVFAVGDVTTQQGADGKPLPGLAAVAKQQGHYVGTLLAARVAGRPQSKPFRYKNFGTLAIIGRSRAVADLPGIALTGTLAWLVWSLVHLMLLVDFRTRGAVYASWCWSWLTYGRGARLVTDVGARRPPAGAA